MLMCVSIAQWASAADDDLDDVGPAGESSEAEAALAEQLQDIEADKSGVVAALVDRFATDEATAYQLESTLAAASAATLAEVEQNADSVEDVSMILGGSGELERLGDTNQDYVYTAVPPCRIVNTNFGGGGLFTPGVARSYYVYGPGFLIAPQGGNPAGCSSPKGEPRAVHINVTAVPQVGNGNGNFKAYADGTPAPGASLVNYKSPGGQNIANAAIIKTRFQLGAGQRELRVLNSFGNAYLIIDILGYYHEAEHLAGADYAGGDQNFTLGPANSVVRSVTITAPAAGRVIVNASGYFDFNDAVGLDTGRCSITTGLAVDFSNLIIAGERTGTAMNWVPFAGTRGFNVGAGNTTFRLVCNEFNGNIEVEDTHLTATWVPRSY
jgi:hypothetical protein